MSTQAKQLAKDLAKDKFSNKEDVKNEIANLSPQEKQELIDQLTTTQLISGAFTAGWGTATYFLSQNWKKGAGWKAGTIVTGIFTGSGVFTAWALLEAKKALKKEMGKK